MAFSIGQFLGSPMIGDYADRKGRRKALILSTGFTFLGLVITAISVRFYSLPFLFIGRLITGVFASSGPVCLASVADLSSTKEEKSLNFGYFGAFAGVSFVIGAFAGGKLSDPTVNSAFSFDLPLWIASGLCLLNYFFVLFWFSDGKAYDVSKKFSLNSAFQNLRLALSLKKFYQMYGVYFLFIFAWTILLQYIPVDVIHRFHFTSSNIGDLALFVGICWAASSGQLKKWLMLFFSNATLLKVLFAFGIIFVSIVSYPKGLYPMLLFLGLSVATAGMIWPLCTSIISDMASKQMQGKILSISQSIQALAISLAAIIGGISFHISLHAPFLLAALALIFSLILFWFHNGRSSYPSKD